MNCRLFILLLLGWALCLPGISHGQTASQIKAVFLYNFAIFVTWPESAFESDSSPLCYCVIDAPLLASTLETVIHGETINGRPLILRHPVENLDRCHILFINTRNNKRLREILRTVQSRNVLTVSDRKDFSNRGGMITLTHRNKRIHPIINLDAVQRVKLHISSKLLRLASLVGSDEAVE